MIKEIHDKLVNFRISCELLAEIKALKINLTDVCRAALKAEIKKRKRKK